ncbi:MAG TPA: GTP cyclohydrolase II [Candidatus Nanoarchaeia archaeon]|nr:GTP cyclohydrolase II [Candidatus Nanoarchaeia archaeon]
MVKILKTAEASLPTEHGNFRVIAFECDDGNQHVAAVKGEAKSNVLVRIHSECLTGDVLHSMRCDCHQQITQSLDLIGKSGGILLYLRQEGRGIGLLNKIRAYSLQDKGMDTVDANLHLGFKADERDYKVAAEILKSLNVTSIQLLTNNPEKVSELENSGIKVERRLELPSNPNEINKPYLDAKKKRLGHLL